MNSNELLKEIRNNIDKIDDQIIELLEDRMGLVDQVSDAKRVENLPTRDQAREDEIISRVINKVNEENKGEAITLINTLMALSKYRQRKQTFDIGEEDLLPASKNISKEKLSSEIKVAYQGIPGAYGEEAALNLYPESEQSNEQTFEDVFKAVGEGKVDYGIVPIENSKTGAIGETYDLLRKYGCYIVGQTTVLAGHCLLGLPGTDIKDIRTIMSHAEGINQCSQFLRKYSWDRQECKNTAVAVKTVAEKNDPKYAAIGSKRAGELYGLEVLRDGIMDDPENATRFIAIAASPEYDEHSDRISITFRTSHESGALCQVLFHFLAAGINLERIESRPMMGEQFCFFADLEGNIEDDHIIRGLKYGGAATGYLEVLGCYPANSFKL